MNRTIKFRGKRVDNGEWFYGSYVVDPKGWHRIYYQPFDDANANTFEFVIPETVGQFTGLLDKDGKEIYEGDVDDKGWIVCFENGVFCMKQKINSPTYIAMNDTVVSHISNNIHDNPELLEEKA